MLFTPAHIEADIINMTGNLLVSLTFVVRVWRMKTSCTYHNKYTGKEAE